MEYKTRAPSNDISREKRCSTEIVEEKIAMLLKIAMITWRRLVLVVRWTKIMMAKTINVQQHKRTIVMIPATMIRTPLMMIAKKTMMIGMLMIITKVATKLKL